MDEIVKKVIARLEEREHSVLTYDYGTQNYYSKDNFLDYQTIRIKGINAIILQKITSLKEEQFVSWLLDGIHYGINFHFYLSTSIYQLIPLELLMKWPIKIYNEKNQRVIFCPKKAITYKEMMSFPIASILMKTHTQIITDLAIEAKEKQHIEIIERF